MEINKKIVLRIVIILASLILISLFSYYVIYHAHLSVIGACRPDALPAEAVILGTFSIQLNTTDNITDITTEIQINENIIDTKYYIPVLKHELCHLRQYNQNRLFGCKNPALLLLNEIECYSIQRFYELLY